MTRVLLRGTRVVCLRRSNKVINRINITYLTPEIMSLNIYIRDTNGNAIITLCLT